MTEAPPLRVSRPPACDGPYDDERTEPVPPVDGTLALALDLRGPARPLVPLRLVPPAVPSPGDGPCPALRPVAPRIAQAIAEVLAGGRSAAQLAGFATYEVLLQLERSSGRLNGRRPGPSPRPKVTSVHVSRPGERIAEVCAVFDTGQRRRAIAFRLEAPRAQWRCTALQIA